MSWEIALVIYLYFIVIDFIVTFFQDHANDSLTMKIVSSVIVAIFWPIIYSLQLAAGIRAIKG